MQEQTGSIDLTGSHKTAKDVEVFPGVHERRYFLRASLATVAAVVALLLFVPAAMLAFTVAAWLAPR